MSENDATPPRPEWSSSFAAAALGVAMSEDEQLARALSQSMGTAPSARPTVARNAEEEAFLDAARAFNWERVKEMATERPQLINVQRPRSGYSALHQAATASAEDEIMWLLQRGADANALTNDVDGRGRKRPVDVARAEGATAVAIALLEPPPSAMANSGRHQLRLISLSLFFHDEGSEEQWEAPIMQLPLLKIYLREGDALWATTPSSIDVHEFSAALAMAQLQFALPVEVWHQKPGAAVGQVEAELRDELQRVLDVAGVSVLRMEGNEAVRRFLTLSEPSSAALPSSIPGKELTRARACAAMIRTSTR